jgi:hypothetical protein
MHLAEDYAAILAELGDHSSAVRLLAAADLIHERSGIPRSRAQQAEIAGPLAKAHAAMPGQEWDTAYQQGRNTPLEDLLSQPNVAAEATPKPTTA